jgi:osmotically-inducible protein OsmY
MATLMGCAAFGGCGLRGCTTDAATTVKVRTLFAQTPEFAPNAISVQTIHGVVYLRGLVSTPFQIEQAGSIAAQAPGVSAVRNLINIDNSR